MRTPVPTFTGYAANESIIIFLDDFELYAATKGFDDWRQRLVLEASLRGPAKNQFQNKIADGTITLGANTAEHLNNCKTWLRQEYHTEDIKQGIKDQLSATYQQMNESPREYYQRIRYLIDMAGIGDALKDYTAEQQLMNGLHKELSLQLRSAERTLNLQEKVDYAHRYWSARNPARQMPQQDILQTQEPVQPRENPRNMIRPTQN